MAKFLQFLFPFKVHLTSGFSALLIGFAMQVWLRLLYRIASYFKNCLTAIYLFIIEHKRIVKIPFAKKVLYTLTWPIFDIIGRYTTYLALFVKVTWKPIPHESKATITDIEKGKEKVMK